MMQSLATQEPNGDLAIISSGYVPFFPSLTDGGRYETPMNRKTQIMSNQFDVAKVLDSLHEAKTAYEAVPGLKQRINDLEAQVTRMTSDSDELATKLGEVERAKAETEAKLQATREERDQYYFRSEELAEAVAKASSLFGSVAPKTEPVAEVISTANKHAEEVTKAQGQAYLAATGESASPLASEGPTLTTTGSAQEQSATEGFRPLSGDGVTGTSETASTTSVADTSVAPQQPVPEPHSTTTSHSDGGQSADHPTSTTSSPSWSPQGDSASNQDGATPSSAIASASPVSSEGNVHTIPQTQPANTTTEKRYDGEPSWLKPDGMSWQEWKRLGGNIPSYVNVA